jgi:hypothetical protein
MTWPGAMSAAVSVLTSVSKLASWEASALMRSSR